MALIMNTPQVLLVVIIVIIFYKILELDDLKIFRIKLRASRSRRFKIRDNYKKKMLVLANIQLPHFYSILEILQKEQEHCLSHGLKFNKHGELNKTINEI